VEDGGVVIVADALVLHHVLQIADDRRRAQIAAPRWNQRLVHVQGSGKRALDSIEIYGTVGMAVRARLSHCLINKVFRSADVRLAIKIFRQSGIRH
jgi:hypothetical protein